MNYIKMVFVFFTLLVVASCVSAGAYFDLYSGRSAKTNDARAEGFVVAEDGYFLLMRTRSIEGLCIGLLPSEPQEQELRMLNGKHVLITGDYDPQVCGGNRICHDTCGPNAFVRITSIEKRSD